MNHRPYKGVDEPPPRPRLVHAIIGAVLVALVFFGLLFLWALIEPNPAQISQSPTLEQAEKAAMSPQKIGGGK